MIDWDRPTWRIQKQQIDEMVDLWENTNLSINSIARQMRISVTSVNKCLKRAGCNTSIIKPTFWTPERLQYIIDHNEEGNIIIARHFGKGMSPNAIGHQKSILRKKGYVLPRKRTLKENNDKI